MTSRSEALAARVQKSNDDLLATVEASTPEQWAARCTDGEWTQAFAAYHAGTSIGTLTPLIQGLAAGAPAPGLTMDQVNQGNAAEFAAHANASKDEVIHAIRTSGPAAVAMVRRLSDGQLDRPVEFLAGMPASIEQVIEMLMVGHPEGHRQSILGAR